MIDVHPTAVIDKSVELADGVSVGPYAVIKGPARIESGTVVQAHAHVEGPIQIGRDNILFPFSAVGAVPQDLKFAGEYSEVVIGDKNTFREYVTVNRGTTGGGALTRIGSGCLFMTCVHIAHDCLVGDGVIMANAATLAGHITVGDHATIGAYCGIHQFCRVGPYSFIGGYSGAITRDVLPFIKTVGDRSQAKIYGINSVGLTRRSFTEERISDLKEAYRILFRGGSSLKTGLENLKREMTVEGDVRVLVNFIESSERGVIYSMME